MYNHEPKNYVCPFCLLAKHQEPNRERSLVQDIIYEDKYLMAFISRDWWPNNPGHVIIAPKKHFENIYSLPDSLISKVYLLEKKVAIAMKKVYKSSGVSSRQHNEPDGGQDVWHYHVSIFPRYPKDELYLNIYKIKFADPALRKRYALRLKKYLTI